MPHVYVIIFAILLLATILTWVIPAGTYDFIEVNGKSVVDPATFHYIERTPVSLWEMVLSIPEGMVKQASLIIATFIITGAINIINHHIRWNRQSVSLPRFAASGCTLPFRSSCCRLLLSVRWALPSRSSHLFRWAL